MNYELVDSRDPILKQETSKFDFENPPEDPEELSKYMAELMVEKRGVGLAAPQIGLPYSVFVVGDPNNIESVMAFFNPKIVDFSENLVYYQEGCLSYPDLILKIKRPDGVRLRFTDQFGQTTTTKYAGVTARIIQHEYDHLQGSVFIQKANRYHLEQAKKLRNKVQKLRKKRNDKL